MALTFLLRALRPLWRGALFMCGGASISATLVLGIAAVSPATAPVSPSPSTSVMPTVITTMTPEPADTAVPEPTHVIDDIRTMSVAADGVISPPDFDHVFQVQGLPYGPVWLAAHAHSPGRGIAPGNTFLTFEVGDRIDALGTSWRITERWAAPKGDVTTQGPYSNPSLYTGHLIIVSCLPRDSGAATQNTWLVAEPIGAP